ncbi:T-cell surface glycoprotein CD4 isoform X2 [Numida meleagris]|uniref:T-cell surface glycoprotein CD4 isoform X2 n=1 Tax=Numida meleagris TaxID=8996 RepID=UPI000B3DC45A|nr:T-cell surface glycoprotein CD4 isoform X2 [Numida meleagris]
MEMERCGAAVSSLLAIVLVLQLGLIPIMAQQEEQQTGVAGKEVILSCKGINHHKDAFCTWKYKYKEDSYIIMRFSRTQILKGKAPMTHRSELNLSSKQLKVSDLSLDDAGIYICECYSQQVSIALHVFKLTISSNGHFLTSEDLKLTLMQNSSHSQPHLSISLFNNSNNIVKPEILQKEAPQKYILRLKQLEATDSGTWMCHIHSDSPSINQNISFDVKVLGFGEEHLGIMYTTVGNTVILSWHLNFRKIEWKEGFTGKLDWLPQGDKTIHELLDFSVTTRRELHETKTSNHSWFEIPERKTGSTIQVKVPKVQLNHSGKFQCQLEINGRRIQSMRALVVMQVSANPAGPLSRGGKMTLLCQASGPLPSNAHLLWERVNGTQKEMKKSKQHEAKVEVSVSTPGLWNCHLMEDSNRMISLNYTVEEARVWSSYTVIGAIIGASVLVIGLACLSIIVGMRWQRRRKRARRMAQAKQYLLEKKTCQCQQ